MVVSNIFNFHPYLGKWSNLTSIFFRWVETTNQTKIAITLSSLTPYPTSVTFFQAPDIALFKQLSGVTTFYAAWLGTSKTGEVGWEKWHPQKKKMQAMDNMYEKHTLNVFFFREKHNYDVLDILCIYKYNIYVYIHIYAHILYLYISWSLHSLKSIFCIHFLLKMDFQRIRANLQISRGNHVRFVEN